MLIATTAPLAEQHLLQMLCYLRGLGEVGMAESERQRPHRGRGGPSPQVILGLWRDGSVSVPRSAAVVTRFLPELNNSVGFYGAPRETFSDWAHARRLGVYL